MIDDATIDRPATHHSPGAVHPIPVLATINEYGLVCIILAAIESGVHGINYWCPRVELRKEDRVVLDRQDEVTGEYVARNVALGGTLGFFEPDYEAAKQGTWQTLDREKLLRGLGRWLVNGGTHGVVQPQDDGSLDFDIDGPAADIILQYALLGEVRYG